jgi:hypothetical protein
MSTWGKARKKPVVIEFRKVQPNSAKDGIRAERIETREGVLYGYPYVDFIIRGVEGEIYPIKKTIFKKTYDILEE